MIGNYAIGKYAIGNYVIGNSVIGNSVIGNGECYGERGYPRLHWPVWGSAGGSGCICIYYNHRCGD